MFAYNKNCRDGLQLDDLEIVDAVLANFVDEVYASLANRDEHSPGISDDPVGPPQFLGPEMPEQGSTAAKQT